MAAASTKQKLLSLVEDVEIVSKELFEVICVPKAQRPDDVDTTQLISLLVQKDTEIQDALKTAAAQGVEQKKLEALKAEVERRDADISELQNNLKEAETLLSNAIYQAKQKLNNISQAKRRKISSEELIKYAHKISASNAVAAPPNWAQGDPRRPYPTELEMRRGLLGRLSDLPIGLPTGSNLAEVLSGGTSQQIQPGVGGAQSSGGGLSWGLSAEQGSAVLPLTPTHGLLDPRGHGKEHDVEEMNSSDTSSSSSSDE